jgi:DNA repair ATPase RecN
MDKLENAFRLSSFEEDIRIQIDTSKKFLDTFLSSMNKESQSKKDNFEKLLISINQYTDNLNKFKSKLQEIQSYNLTIQSREIESMEHKLSIEYTFKIDKEIFLKTINEFLKTAHKIDSFEEFEHRKLYLSNYKDKPKVDSYEDFKSKVYVKFEELNKRKYKIITKDGKNFDSLSAGWKTSVLLDLILGYDGDTAPLIIDQPEDNLANSYINKGLIDALKKIKEHKQVIIVSHNATIPMLGDAQNIILCQNEEKIIIKSNPLEGIIDGKSVVDHIATITDGGKTSIKKRVKKYNMKKLEETL